MAEIEETGAKDEKSAEGAAAADLESQALAGQEHLCLMCLSMPFYPGEQPWTDAPQLDRRSCDAESYVEAMGREVLGAAGDYSDCRIPALWVGGGVATHMADDKLAKLLRSIRQSFRLAAEDGAPAEITLRTHPGQVSAATMDACRIGHVTNLRFDYATGVEGEAREMGRAYGPSVMDITQMVLGNAKLDLSFELWAGIPGQTPHSAATSVQSALKYGATSVHVGEYRLPEDCKLARSRAKESEEWRALPPHRLPSAEERGEIVAAMQERLAAEGFVEYLPGEWALPGHELRYLQLHAEGMDVLGFGLGARTRFDGVGATNTGKLETYLRCSDDPSRCIAETHLL